MTTYEEINSLDEISFIGGTEYILTFNVYDIYGSPIDINASTCSWRLCYYGQPDYTVLTKSGTITGINTWTVTLLSNETTSLSGKFIHQPTVIDFHGSEFPSQQGIITIIPRIP